jgi:glycosyltransferase involved in cell wall biosynthesis
MKAMKKGLLIFPIYKDLSKKDAILFKNEGIRKGFLANNVDVHVCEFTKDGMFIENKLVLPFKKGKLGRSIDFHFRCWFTLADYCTKHQYDFIWLRLPLINPAIANFIKKVKQQTNTSLILEYGAYPYKKELSGATLLYYNLNRRSELKAHRYADYMITYCGQEEVDGVPNIPIDNGIDLDGIPVSHPVNPENGINLISVSSLKKWHAYERFIMGISEYVKKPGSAKIHFHIVGAGPEYDNLVKVKDQLGLQDYVTFHSFKTGAELDEIYKANHIAIGTLGFHRIGITNSSSLKNREYFARGLPVVLSTPDKDMPSNLSYVLYVEAGENPVDVGSVVEFAKKVYKEESINDKIRNEAEEKVSWNSKIRTVLDFIKKEY